MAITWKKPKANFQVDLAFGRLGELAFLHATKGTLDPLDGKNGDFRIRSSGKKLELKTDRYDHSKTKNFFVESYSYGQKRGGVFRAMEDGSEYFAYYFENPGFLYLFRTVEFMTRVQELQSKYDLTEVANINHTTRGYKMERENFKDLELKPEDHGFTFDSSQYEWYRKFNKADI